MLSPRFVYNEYSVYNKDVFEHNLDMCWVGHSGILYPGKAPQYPFISSATDNFLFSRDLSATDTHTILKVMTSGFFI